jgi:hypothetical protein
MVAVAGGLRVLDPSARLWVRSTVVVGTGFGLPVPTEPDCSVTEDPCSGSEALSSCVVDMGTGSRTAAAPDISMAAPVEGGPFAGLAEDIGRVSATDPGVRMLAVLAVLDIAVEAWPEAEPSPVATSGPVAVDAPSGAPVP